jgi:ferredoxin/tetratricopeptide (TPR) repeat protein
MWVWPAAYRWVWVPLDARLEQSLGAEHWLVEGPRTVAGWLRIPLGPAPPPWRVQNHLVTDDFWRSFAGPAVAAPFLLICGFATVYFLGAKGFCTYGCPYGGFFAPFDRLAAGRIRVNDDCEQCGHCTAVCSSNVRVHEEVHAWGMVVDPGCMKCLDCVSVCPNDALSFGFGRPSLRRGAARAPRPRRRYDLTLAEDVGFTLVFVASFFAVRGVYGLVPLLMAAGTAGCVTFLAWKLWRMLRDANVSFHRWRLKYRDATTVPGHVFTSITVVCLMLVAHSGAIRIMQAVAERHDDRVTMARATVLSPRPEAMPPEMARHADAAIRWYRRASGFRDGGLGLFTHRGTDVRLAWLHACRQEHEAATRHLRRAIARTGGTEARHRDLVDLLRLQGLPNEALAHQHAVVEAEPSYVALMDHLVEQYVVNERHDDALALARRGLDRAPRDRALPLLRRVAMLLVTADRDDEALAAVRGWLEAAPPEPFGLSVLSETQAATGDIAAAIETMELAIEMAPRAIGLRLQLAFLLDAVGRTDEAAAQRDEADRLRRK